MESNEIDRTRLASDPSMFAMAFASNQRSAVGTQDRSLALNAPAINALVRPAVDAAIGRQAFMAILALRSSPRFANLQV
jgi:hypothetical protein